MARETEKRVRGRNNGSMFAALFLLVIISGVVVFSIMAGKRQQKHEQANQSVEEEAPVDPFAHMNYTEEGLAKKVYEGTHSADFESEAELWLRARDVYAEVEALIEESTIKRNEGDIEWRNLTARAEELADEAVNRGEVWRSVLVKEVGEDSSDVARLDKTLQKWRRTWNMLRKTSSR